jgi:hypothetical protein
MGSISIIVLSLGHAHMRGMALSTIGHIAMSPLTQPLMVISILGVLSIDMLSCGSPSPTVASDIGIIVLLQSYQYELGLLCGPIVTIRPPPQVDQLQ